MARAATAQLDPVIVVSLIQFPLPLAMAFPVGFLRGGFQKASVLPVFAARDKKHFKTTGLILM
ncbi:MAG: hypothetical protein ACI83P_002812 [Janthinobacterium sp.]|jgi:hypothetical protein